MEGLLCLAALLAVAPRAVGAVPITPVLLSPTTDPTPTAGTGSPFYPSGLPLGSGSVSDSGRYVVFVSRATNLIANVEEPLVIPFRVFLRDRVLGTTTLVSHALGSPATPCNDTSPEAVISGDGRFIAFASSCTDLTATPDNPNTGREVYRYAVATGTVIDVSYSATATGSTNGYSPRISRDGSVIAFASFSPDLIPGQVDNNSAGDYFVWDGRLSLVSRAASGWTTAGDGALTYSHAFDLSPDGRHLAFVSDASDLVAGSDTNAGGDLFQFDRWTGTMRRVSTAVGGGAAGDGIADQVFTSSPDGAWIAYASTSSNLASGVTDTNAEFDVYLWDRERAQSGLVSHVAGDPATATGDNSVSPRVSDDGRFVLVQSNDSGLVPGGSDTNLAPDLFLFDRVGGGVQLVSHQAGSPTTAASTPNSLGSFEGVLSADGDWAAFTSNGSDLVAGQVGSAAGPNTFLWQRATSTTSLVSHALGLPTTEADAPSEESQLTSKATALIFRSTASDLTAAIDTNDGFDAFGVFDLLPSLLADPFESGGVGPWSQAQYLVDTTLSSTPGNPSSAASAGFTFASLPAGALFECSLDGVSFTGCASPYASVPLSDGEHDFAVRAKTANGVDPSPATHSWRVDLAAPETAIHTGPANPTSATTATFTFSSNEGLVTFGCQLDGGGFSACSSPGTYSSLGLGFHTFQVRAIDAAGNPDATPDSETWEIQ